MTKEEKMDTVVILMDLIRKCEVNSMMPNGMILYILERNNDKGGNEARRKNNIRKA